MKTFNLLCAFICFTFLVVSCSENEPDGGTQNPDGEKGTVVLTFTTGSPLSRSAGSAEEALEGDEGTLVPGDGLRVYAFNADGKLNYSTEGETGNRLALTQNGNVYETDPFVVSSGDKYFILFANDGSTGGRISDPASSTLLETFMKQELTVQLTGDEPDLAGTKFLMGSLWKEKKVVPLGGTDDNPTQVSLGIGRLVAKINLDGVNTQINSQAGLSGTFGSPKYRLGSIARKVFIVGNHVGVNLPTEHGVTVTSAVHEAAPWADNTDVNFLDYYAGWKDPQDTFYATENTTAPDQDDYQYFGNTTFIQLETVYAPSAAEIYDPETMSNNQTLTGGTFWTARIVDAPATLPAAMGGKRVILNSDPALASPLHADIQTASSYPEYTGGKNYHKFPVFDPDESLDVCRNRVLRNHYYELSVSEFMDLGSHTKDVDPQEPIPSKSTVVIEVTVKNWNKVTGSTPVG